VLTNASRRWFAAVLPVLPLSARYIRLERRTASIAGGEGGGRVGCIEFLRNVLRTIGVPCGHFEQHDLVAACAIVLRPKRSDRGMPPVPT
jgi:hypothetical protein